MENVGFDTESYLITDTVKAPRLVCGSWALHNPVSGEYDTSITLRGGTKEAFLLAYDLGHILVIQNAAFDMTLLLMNFPELLPKILEMYEQKRIICTQTNESLHLIGRDSGYYKMLTKQGGLSLAANIKRHTGVDISHLKKGPDIWRLRYNELDGRPLEEWPIEAKEYAEGDAAHHLMLYERQVEKYGPVLQDLYIQQEADFFLSLMSIVGFATDPVQAEKMDRDTLAVLNEHLQELLDAGFYVFDKKKKADGNEFPYKLDTKVYKALIVKTCEENGLPIPRKEPTEKMVAKGVTEGNIDTSKTVHQELAKYNKTIKSFSDITTTKNNRDTFIKFLKLPRVHSRYRILKASGRTSSEKPNMQNLPQAPGYRECLVADPGYILVATDYSYVELVSLAYVHSQVLNIPVESLELYKTINADRDPHYITAIQIMKANGEEITYEEITNPDHPNAKHHKEMRQLAKVPNFGFPGGMGSDTLCTYARDSYGIDISPEESAKLKIAWQNAYPEMKSYFDYVSNQRAGSGFRVQQVSTDRVRGGCAYCSACNSYFQGLAADGFKRAIINTGRFMLNNSELGISQKAEVHDEIIFQIYDRGPKENDTVIRQLEEIMVASMKQVMPAMLVKVETSLMRRWSKGAKTLFDENGYYKVDE